MRICYFSNKLLHLEISLSSSPSQNAVNSCINMTHMCLQISHQILYQPLTIEMVLPVIFAAVFPVLALYWAVDPFKHGLVSKFRNFKAYKVDLPAWSELPEERDAENLLQKSEIRFLDQAQGPESTAFDPLGRGPYAGVADGRVIFWNGESWTDFAYTSPKRSELCGPKPILAYAKNEHVCGRPLGLRFDAKTGDLYIADAYFGLMKVGPNGGLATSLATEAEGVPFRFTNDLDIDDDGNVYFTDSSSNYQRREFIQLMISGEPSGRVLKYNPVTKETTVLLRNLQFPNGLSLSKDQSFFVFCDGAMGRLKRYWLTGEKAGTSDVFAVLPGFPDNVRRNENGEFWVAIHSRRTMFTYILGTYPRLRYLWLSLPIPPTIRSLMSNGDRHYGGVVKYSNEGKLLQILEDIEGKVVKLLSQAEEKDGKLYMGSVMLPSIAVYQLESGV